MAEQEQLSAGKIAKELGVSDAKVKKAIKELGLEPDSKKGACGYYGPESVAKLKKALEG
ncbi:MAG: HTH domain-containing protein [Myxococcota bacterium]|jgi:hypothetical protein|nr:HTH domain-containing protein [Myxococcota bacterium]